MDFADPMFYQSEQELATLDRDVKLNEFTKEEWLDIVHEVRPDLTREEYDILWDNFIQLKAQRQLQ